jgi:F0F1-type ATP synthase membrane subunit a
MATTLAPLFAPVIVLSMASFGRLLQIVGLVFPPLSIVLQLQGNITAGQMLVILVMSVSLFMIGRIVEGYARQ